MIDFIKNIFRKRNKIANKNVERSNYLYHLILWGFPAGLIYFTISLFTSLPWWPSLSALYIIVLFISIRLLLDNWLLMWLFISDTRQGRLLFRLNERTMWSKEHKLKFVKWTYLNRGTIRSETH